MNDLYPEVEFAISSKTELTGKLLELLGTSQIVMKDASVVTGVFYEKLKNDDGKPGWKITITGEPLQ